MCVKHQICKLFGLKLKKRQQFKKNYNIEPQGLTLVLLSSYIYDFKQV